MNISVDSSSSRSDASSAFSIFARIVRRLRVDRGRAHRQRHDQRRAVAVARHVADHHARPARAQPEEVVEVAADALGGDDAGRHHRLGRDDLGAREQPHLEVVRELHLVHEPLLRERRRARAARSGSPCRSASRSR